MRDTPMTWFFSCLNMLKQWNNGIPNFLAWMMLCGLVWGLCCQPNNQKILHVLSCKCDTDDEGQPRGLDPHRRTHKPRPEPGSPDQTPPIYIVNVEGQSPYLPVEPGVKASCDVGPGATPALTGCNSKTTVFLAGTVLQYVA
jgi:hypothetical protein